MFGKTVLSATVALALALQASAHAAVNPPLGVASGTAVRNDVQRPNNNCGGINVASTIDTSKTIALAADGTFSATADNFNAGADGSLKFTAAVDATGVGKTFTPATVTANGDGAPTKVESAQLTVQLPAGTQCKGGKAGNLCLVSFVSSAGFGNCVVVQQAAAAGGAAAAAPPAAASAAAPPAAASSVAAATASAAAAPPPPPAAAAAGAAAAGAKGKGHHKGHHKGAKAAAAAAQAAGAQAAAGGAAAAAAAPAAAAAAPAAGAAGAGAAAAAAVTGAKAAGARSVVRRRLVDME